MVGLGEGKGKERILIGGCRNGMGEMIDGGINEGLGSVVREVWGESVGRVKVVKFVIDIGVRC